MRSFVLKQLFTVPNLLSLIRLCLTPVLVVEAIAGNTTGFLFFLALSLLTDFADGALARWLNQATPLGAELDSWADIASNSALAFGVWRLWPVFFREQELFIVASLGSYALSLLLGFLKYGRVISFHTRGERWAAVLLVLSVPVFLLGGGAWSFRVAAIFTLIAQIEKMIMTIVLPDWLSDVRSHSQAVKMRQDDVSDQPVDPVCCLSEGRDDKLF